MNHDSSKDAARRADGSPPPAPPNLVQQRKRAKDLAKAHRRGDADARVRAAERLGPRVERAGHVPHGGVLPVGEIRRSRGRFVSIEQRGGELAGGLPVGDEQRGKRPGRESDRLGT